MNAPNPSPWSAFFSGISFKIIFLLGLIFIITGALNIYLAMEAGKKGQRRERERTFDQSAQMVNHLMTLQRRILEDRIAELSLNPGLLRAVRDSEKEKAESTLLASRRLDTTGLLEILFISKPGRAHWADVSLDLFGEAADIALSHKDNLSHREWRLLLTGDNSGIHYLIYSVHLTDPVTGRVMAMLRGGIRITENPVLIQQWRKEAGLQGLALVWQNRILLSNREDKLPWPSMALPSREEKREGRLYYAMRPLADSRAEISLILAIASHDMVDRDTPRILATFAGSTAFALILLLVLLLRQVAAPLKALSAQAGNLPDRKEGLLEIPEGQGYSELESLVASFNALLLEMRRSEARFRIIFDHGYFQAGLVTSEGIVEIVNQRALDAMGMTASDVEGTPLVDTPWWKRSEDRNRLMLAMNLATSGIEDRFEAKQQTVRGQTLTVLVNASPIQIRGKRQVLVSGVDISDRKRTEMALAEERSRLAQLNLSLETRVAERTRDLHAALENLQKTQEELLRSEKMSALGALVAGVSHELNTPLGNAITVSSTLMDAQRRFTQKLESGLTRSDLKDFLETVEEASTLLDRNLERAADLVSSFKQVAVDQSSYQRRTFELNEVIDEIILTMGPAIRKTSHRLKVSVAEGITMDSYPGPLGQILMNLITNALTHAFGEGICGEIVIHAQRDGEKEVLVSIEDNGSGIPEENRARIFDPFFTTRLGQGGSGLGLHIVFNLVQELLGGHIFLDAHRQRGSAFVIRLPLTAPVQQSSPSTEPMQS
ncbi:PAS domain S-box-containing protein [Desulfobotulus alkaliphilus]|uniref:histidine kinase n=1 Tax=Desulfobotulus alkaliphilus TaxID=622671 RepID=A0A562RX25_9BACT|nr:ATP-binding protein [Desulfobotulus alkaliphilus]TWI73084.1 PAS domain S-box-containing protein [Desulfobotulus alkaliphilus]